jgi:23S rRNA pseudouridine1911/1915/1917 synthase
MSSWISNQTGRLDVILATLAPDYSRSRLQKLIQAGNVAINDLVITSPKHTVAIGDAILFQEPAADPDQPLAEHRDLDILFEDADVIAINKPVGMVVHPNDFHDEGTLVQALLGLRPEVASAIYDPENPVSRLRPGIVHRLDKDTSGVIIVAKNRDALLNLAQQFHDHTVSKEYETILYGVMAKKQRVDAPMRRKGGGDKNIMGASHTPGEGREAISVFEPIRSWAPYPAWPQEQVTHTKVQIETGRTHQIRVHAKFIGHPVIGDSLYGNKPSQKLSSALGIHHQLLHAARLTFHHPSDGRSITVTAPLPPHFLRD